MKQCDLQFTGTARLVKRGKTRIDIERYDGVYEYHNMSATVLLHAVALGRDLGAVAAWLDRVSFATVCRMHNWLLRK